MFCGVQLLRAPDPNFISGSIVLYILVGGLEQFSFLHILEIIIHNRLIFFRGVETTDQIYRVDSPHDKSS